MSWSFGFTTDGTLSAFDAALSAAKDTFTAEQEGYGNPPSEETLSQITAAGGAARKIVESHAVGSDDKSYNVVLTGHANPAHEPVVGIANDQVHVSVSQVA
jgi:hypothetical protein